ncbi:MAG: hypothetical protein K2N33_04585 [Clostridia bacterium]|nr:hypothetical protein [Clostridia bacterium]
MKKKIIFVLAAAVMAFVCTFSLAGCELASNVQKNCNHNWVLQRNSSSLREATCSEQGISAVYKCIKCQKTRYEYSPKLPHTFNEDENAFQSSCGSSVSVIQQRCTVCNDVVTVRLPVVVHNLGAPVFREAYEATLVDIGRYTQEEYDALPAEQIEHEKVVFSSQLREISTCAYTEQVCSSCNASVKEYEHRIDEINQKIIDDMTEEVKATGNCGSTVSVECKFCSEYVQFFFHDYEEEEVIYSSTKLIIRKMLCKYCRDEVKYEVEFL